MMEIIDYSVVIRTTGNAHEKYQNLLNSVSNLIPPPKEIIVVLPEGYDLPEEKLGWETYYFSPKGMIIQRTTGINKCLTKYALVCDDDVEFDVDFVQKLYNPIKKGICKLSIGPLYSFLPKRGINSFLSLIMANASPTLFHKDRYISVLRSSGYSYNRNLKMKYAKYYETQSGPWTCFFGEVEALKRINIDEEIWLDKHGYSAMDDQTMFYKGCLRGIKTMTVPNAEYIHLDAGTSKKNNRLPVMFSTGFNRVVFWHRFIYCKQRNVFQKGWARLCVHYYLMWLFIFDIYDLLRKGITWNEFLVKRNGYKSGWKYTKSDEYKKLPPV